MTDRVPFHAHTTHSATGASLSTCHVFGTVFRPTCATRTLHTAVSGVNSKRFVLMQLPGRNESGLLLIALYKYPYLLTYLHVALSCWYHRRARKHRAVCQREIRVVVKGDCERRTSLHCNSEPTSSSPVYTTARQIRAHQAVATPAVMCSCLTMKTCVEMSRCCWLITHATRAWHRTSSHSAQLRAATLRPSWRRVLTSKLSPRVNAT